MASSDPAARASDLTRRFGGLAAVDDVSLDLARRRGARGDRHQRRGQVDADQHAVGRAAAPAAAGRAASATTSRAGRSRGARAPASAAATSAPRSSRASRCSRTAASPRRRSEPAAVGDLGARRAALRGSSARGARAALARAGLTATCSSAPAGALSHGEQAPARDRDVPGHRAARCCCSTSRSPAWAPRRPSACWQLLARAEGAATRSCWSSTTWTRCSASPTDHRDGQRRR